MAKRKLSVNDANILIALAMGREDIADEILRKKIEELTENTKGKE